MAEFETVLTETHGRVRLITLNRPQALNALSRKVGRDVIAAATEAELDPAIGCLVITGSAKTFAAGADIKEMQPQSFLSMQAQDWFAEWEQFTALRKPIIAAVAGYAIGGGCELAMMCDFILAAENARFGQPEIKLGLMPGMGGSQRLTRLIGGPKAMEMCLTGRMMDAAEAERLGLVARVVSNESLLDEALKTAGLISEMSLPAVLSIKDAIRRASDMALADGVRYERRLFHALFATEDQKEGTAAFMEKRVPIFHNR
ncbi:enoyl-CoA hydratase-related protein [Pseudotabrizicola sp. 4114]|uniref:enoyl-CoA hydratase-related protein n=1 Tax=Pseudotabrizicola sp. 4114 TaxID=2817731 RepID=UPI00286189A6|nr:enoyl-CoA hydratase [Pseudorhodobacter sp. 4114]